MLKKAINKYKMLPKQVKASFWFLICAFLQKGISLITTPIFTRLMSTAEYGKYNVFNSWLTIITVFVSLNLYYGVYIQGLVKFEDKKKEYTSALQGLCLTSVCVWTVIYLIFHDFWNRLFSLTTVQMTAMILMIWASSVFRFWAAQQRVELKYIKLVTITIIVSIAKPLIGIFCVVFAEDKVTARILGLAAVEVVAYTALFFKHMTEGKVFFSKKIWKYALCFNLPLIPHYLSQSVLSGADRIMIEKMTGEAEAGIYSLAYSVSLIMILFNTALIQTVEPWMYKKIKEKKYEEIGKIIYPSFIIIALVNILLMMFAPEIVGIFAPKAYYDAIWVIPPVSMSVFFMFTYTFFSVFEFYYEKTGLITLATMAGAALNIILNYIFIGIFGYYAAGYTTLLCYMVYSVMHFIIMKWIFKKYIKKQCPYSTRMLFIITLVFMGTGFIFLFTYYNRIIRYILIAVLFIVLFIIRNKLINITKNIINLKKNK